MKKLSLFFALFIIAATMQGQTYWSVSGNSNLGSSNFIGTTDAQALNFRTNNVNRMTLSQSKAFLGIGTTSPNANLHVHSTVYTIGYYTDFQLTNTNTGSERTDGFHIQQQNKNIFIRQLEKANLYFQNNNKGFVLDTNGYFGFNTVYPKQRIHVVDGNIMISRTSARAPGSTNGSLLFGGDVVDGCSLGDWGIEYVNSTDEGYGLNFWRPFTQCHTGFNYALFLGDDGNVGIGTNSPQAKLSVNGNVCAKEVRVSLNGSPCWPDYVFAQDYDLMKISDLRSYVQQNRHLPGVPSAAEVEENGVELGATTEILLQKIEEMTLYILQLEERVQQLENGKGGTR